MALTIVMLAGLFQIVFGLVKLGRYVSLVPFPVISGFMSGIGCIIIILQLAPLVGQEAPRGGTLAVLVGLPELLGEIPMGLPDPQLPTFTLEALKQAAASRPET